MPARWSLAWSSEWSHDNRLHGALVVVVAFAVAVVRSPVVAPLVAATGRLELPWVCCRPERLRFTRPPWTVRVDGSTGFRVLQVGCGRARRAGDGCSTTAPTPGWPVPPGRRCARAAGADQLGLVQAVDRLGQGVVVGVPLGADRGH